MALHDYQDLAVREIRGHYARGTRKVLLHLATGGGKTHIFSHILKSAAALGTPSIMVVRGRQLVDQASQRLFKEGVRHGVRMAGHWNKDYSALVQVCSIDTLTSREDYPNARLVVIDEAHNAFGDGYIRLIENYRDAYFLGVTATPYTHKPLSHIADVVVHPIRMRELIERGYLVPPRYFAPSTPDLKGVRKQNGDYVSSQLENRMNTLTGDIVQNWIKYGEGRPTILFACNIQHSLSLVRAFEQAGIPAEHVEANHSFAQRTATVDRLRAGRIKIISNVGILCTGVDIPFVGCIIMARPTQSYNLYIQQAGRGTRTCPDVGKCDFIILDHAGNILRHGFIDEEPECDLEGSVRERSGPEPHTCKVCYVVFEGSECPECGAPARVRSDRSTELVVEDGVLEEIKHLPLAAEITIFVNQVKRIQKLKNYKRGWIWHQVKEKYGEEVANQVCPKRYVPPWIVSRTRQTGS